MLSLAVGDSDTDMPTGDGLGVDICSPGWWLYADGVIGAAERRNYSTINALENSAVCLVYSRNRGAKASEKYR